jgi:hypothetical protein
MMIRCEDSFEAMDGTTTLVVEHDDEFRKWFMEQEGLSRFSNKRLEKWVIDTLEKYLESHEDVE